MRRAWAILAGFFWCSSFAAAAEVRDVAALGKCFQAGGVSGTFVLLDPAKDVLFVHNRTRAEARFVPASTFKIVNTLIGLRTGAVANVDVVLPYGGAKQPIAAWEKDMNLRQAIRVSNVPVYQELARRVGLERMRESVAAFRYGNGELGTVVDRFWLDGPLKISAVEQAEFLGQLARRKLAVAEEHIAGVEEITLVEEKQGSRLHGKTGWQPPIGWWVGWIHREKDVFTFALNIDLTVESDAPKRVAVGKACLRVLGKWE